MGKYDDIINMEHPEPIRRGRMSMKNRAAQFAPFAALVGHDAALEYTSEEHVKEWNESSGKGLSRGEFEDI